MDKIVAILTTFGWILLVIWGVQTLLALISLRASRTPEFFRER